MIFIYKPNRSVIVTFLGVIVALVGGWLALDGQIDRAFICLVLSAFCDVLDGPMARGLKRPTLDKKFGVEIDSLADTISFLVLPIVIFYSLGLNSRLDLIIFGAYLLAGVTRLAYFNCQASVDKPVEYYRGLPVTLVVIIFTSVWLVAEPLIGADSALIVYRLLMLLLAALFMLNVKIKKSNKLIVFSSLVLVLAFIVRLVS